MLRSTNKHSLSRTVTTCNTKSEAYKCLANVLVVHTCRKQGGGGGGGGGCPPIFLVQLKV